MINPKKFILIITFILGQNEQVTEAVELTDVIFDDSATSNGEYESILKKCQIYNFPTESFDEQPDNFKVYNEVAKIKDGPFKNSGLDKFVNVFGIKVLGESSTSNDKILHVANALANILDNDFDGKPDNVALIKELQSGHPILFVMKSSETIVNLMSGNNQEFDYELRYCPFFFDFEEQDKILPKGKRGDATCKNKENKNDRTVAFIIDQLIGRGFYGFFDKDTIEQFKEYYKESVEAETFDISNTGCPLENENCHLIMYISWATTSLLDMDKCWCQQADALRFCDKESMISGEPDLSKLLISKIPKAITEDIKKYHINNDVVFK